MKINRITGIIFVLMTLVWSISASSYEMDYTQVGDKLVIKETLDGAEISNYVSESTLEKSKEGYYFVEKLVFNQSYENAKVIVNLDTGFVLEEDGIFPSGYSLQTDGQIIQIVWNLKNAQKDQDFAMFIKIKGTSKNNSLFWGIVILLVVIIAGIIFNNKRQKAKIIPANKKPAKKQTKENEAYDYLLDTEKKIVELLKSSDRNELWQKQIQNSTGFSKAKVSRLIRNLEARGLIAKIPFGNTNKVRLK